MKFKPSYTSSIAEDIMAERPIRAQAVEFLADARFARHHGAPEGQDLRQPLPH